MKQFNILAPNGKWYTGTARSVNNRKQVQGIGINDTDYTVTFIVSHDMIKDNAFHFFELGKQKQCLTYINWYKTLKYIKDNHLKYTDKITYFSTIRNLYLDRYHKNLSLKNITFSYVVYHKLHNNQTIKEKDYYILDKFTIQTISQLLLVMSRDTVPKLDKTRHATIAGQRIHVPVSVKDIETYLKRIKWDMWLSKLKREYTTLDDSTDAKRVYQILIDKLQQRLKELNI